MTDLWWWLAALAVAAAVGLMLAWRPLRRLGGAIQVERARELFLLQRERIQALFLPAAAATGKPRGLRWKECVFSNEIVFARDRQNRQLLALVSVAIQFEAVEGSDMEENPNVGYPRHGSAVFFFQTGLWLTTGKALFNMNPSQALQHFQTQYEQVASTTEQHY
jgi:hypothetical protein